MFLALVPYNASGTISDVILNNTALFNRLGVPIYTFLLCSTIHELFLWQIGQITFHLLLFHYHKLATIRVRMGVLDIDHFALHVLASYVPFSKYKMNTHEHI